MDTRFFCNFEFLAFVMEQVFKPALLFYADLVIYSPASEPFLEMQGDIIYVDYELSGWKYLNNNSKSLLSDCNGGKIIYKKMIQPDDVLKESGSAYGGKWKPKKTEDEKFFR